MKVLISAITCDPSGGSEGGVGWNAVKLIANDHDVRVLVHSSCENKWKLAEKNGRLPNNVRVRFLCASKPWHPNRFLARMQSWYRLIEFNRELIVAARAWHAEEPFDLAHHITYATWRVASPLWQLPVPFIWGPIGGAANFPNTFFSILSPSAKFFEIARKVNGALASRSKSFKKCIRNAAVVLAANEETESFLRPFRGDRPMLMLPVAYLSDERIKQFRTPVGFVRKPGPLRLFAGGSMIGSKGLSLAVRALRKVKDAGIAFHYTIAGGGPEIPRITTLVRELGLEHEVEFNNGFKGCDYVHALQNSDVFFLPSFREALGLTMVEAVLAGCYPIVADASAPGELVRIAGGKAIRVSTPEIMVDELASAILEFNENRESIIKFIDTMIPSLIGHLSINNYQSVIKEAYRQALSHHNSPSCSG